MFRKILKQSWSITLRHYPLKENKKHKDNFPRDDFKLSTDNEGRINHQIRQFCSIKKKEETSQSFHLSSSSNRKIYDFLKLKTDTNVICYLSFLQTLRLYYYDGMSFSFGCLSPTRLLIKHMIRYQTLVNYVIK